MDFEKYTDRARGFVQSGQSFAVREGHRQFAPEDPLAELILSGGIKDGQRVTISVGKQGLTFHGQIAEAA